jgi:steroid 5-alpha reductase family enzyme
MKNRWNLIRKFVGNPHMLLIALIANLLTFTAAWAFCVKIKNYSPVDAFWAFCIGSTAMYYLLFQSNLQPRSLVAAILITTWSLRLTYHLTRRVMKHRHQEDPRYQKLRAHWGSREKPMFYLFFLGQALSVVILAFPFYLIAKDSGHGFGFLPILGTVIASMGLLGETIADKQMSSFKHTHPDPKAVCQTGLWRYSRHPNYFFESVIWCGFFIFAIGSPWGWTSIYAPVMITYLLLKVTGIPPTEAAALQRKGDAYRTYQLTTPAFIPKFNLPFLAQRLKNTDRHPPNTPE